MKGEFGTLAYRRLGAYFSSCGLFTDGGKWKDPAGKTFLKLARGLATQSIFDLPKG